MSAKTVYMVYGGPASPDKADEVARWYEPHLIEMCTLPGLISAQLFKPASVQLPRLTCKLPQTMAIYEFDTNDLAGAFKTLWANSLTRRIAPPADGIPIVPLSVGGVNNGPRGQSLMWSSAS